MPSRPSSQDDRISVPAHYPSGNLVQAWLRAGSLAFSLLLLVLLLLAMVDTSGLAGIDLAIVSALHEAHNPHDPVGSTAVESIARDITALGSNTILLLITLTATVLLTLMRRGGAAILLFSTAATALLLNALVKAAFERVRPDFASVTISAETSSFPSSHAMLTCVVLLVIAAIAARELSSRAAAGLLMATAIAVTVLVGLTRIYLGAHWPSDVIAGWTLGAAWVLLAFKLTEAPRPPK